MSDWIEEIRLGLRLSPRGVLILVDHAVPERLGGLARALLADHPDLEVLARPSGLMDLPDGSVVVLVPEAEDAFWLNMNRPVFARKSLKVVLFCRREVTEVLAREAPDFYDWIAQRHECPPGVAEHAVFGIRQALRCRAPGILFAYGYKNRHPLERQARIERFERVFREALPGRTIRWIEANEPYARIVHEIETAGRAWVACDTVSSAQVERFRWALAEARRKTRAILLVPYYHEDRFWNISDDVWDRLGVVIKLLTNAGARHPGRLAAVSGLEDDLIASLIELLRRGYPEDELFAAMLRSADPGAGLGERILNAGLARVPVQGDFITPPVQRHLGKRIGLWRRSRRPARQVSAWMSSDDGGEFPLLRGHASRIEFLLCQGERTPERWSELSQLAYDQGHFDVAHTWEIRALELEESSTARRWAEKQWLAKHIPRLFSFLLGLALSLNRSGRAADAEVLLRRLLGLPVEGDLEPRFLGLSGRDNLLAFVQGTHRIELSPENRKELWNELASALRAQGRHLEAAEVEAQRDQDLDAS
ncbi:hypothetical protein [Polyangium sp. 15x6]|uniref:hypothetical protein n=1 Tax=Polyangium sp. 15x6 TaxID=3042687 RepID=UPI00249B37CF|nr:hypothetical protein [Polyangium sp. 15x6]MDI3285950.1 hypothetical protein [Polyangium sp. 15x6]